MPSAEQVHEAAGTSLMPPPARSEPKGSGLLLGAYASAIFLSAFLLFQVQPLIGKFILPWFGGMPSVWTTCMLFFQMLLFGGYAYAHLVSSRLSPRAQAAAHVVLLIVACGALPIVPADSWKPQDSGAPIARILCLLAVTVGLPFFVLSSTGPLLQGWFSRTHRGRSPYRLYALSNVGSLIALVSYPVAFDWTLPTRLQARIWSWGFVVFAALCSVCAGGLAWVSRTAGEALEPSSPLESAEASAPLVTTRVLWFLLAMVPSILLLATTNQVCLDVASVPFLWVLPLTLYLLSFILCFDGEHWYSRRFLIPATVLALAGAYPVLSVGATVPFLVQLPVYFTILFLGAMVCHGELVQLKPDVRHLTSFYLHIAAGGAAGGIFVGLIAPLVFTNYFELHVGLFLCGTLILAVLFTDPLSRLHAGRPRWVWLLMLVAIGVYGGGLVHHAITQRSNAVAVARNFYGVLRIAKGSEGYNTVPQPIYSLMNGRIRHGFEYRAPELRDVPTTYYGPETGVGRVMTTRMKGAPARVGLVGMGIGTLAAYARPGDSMHFYEINSTVLDLASRYFHYLAGCKGHVDWKIGDARLTLEAEPPQNFDVLVLDAFSGDAIPVHLLTKEAFSIYLRHMAPHGVIAVHTSNRHFNLGPVVAAVADAHGLASLGVVSQSTLQGGFNSLWVLVARDAATLDALAVPKTAVQTERRRVLWTDDHAGLFQVLW